jgi:aromatic-L-amino-acid decarboxylase
LEDLVIYTTTQTHSLGSKAGLVLGIQVHAIEVSHDDQFALRGKALRDALEEDARIGRKPFILSKFFYPWMFILRNLLLYSPVATVGTTSSGAVDNMSEIKEVGTKVCRSYSCVYFSYHFISERLSVALGTCRRSMGRQCLVLS